MFGVLKAVACLILGNTLSEKSLLKDRGRICFPNGPNATLTIRHGEAQRKRMDFGGNSSSDSAAY